VSVVVSVLNSVHFLARSRAVLHLEILALRHQLAVANRAAGHGRFTTVALPLLRTSDCNFQPERTKSLIVWSPLTDMTFATTWLLQLDYEGYL